MCVAASPSAAVSTDFKRKEAELATEGEKKMVSLVMPIIIHFWYISHGFGLAKSLGSGQIRR